MLCKKNRVCKNVLLADDVGNQYDLTPLSTSNRMWRVLDPNNNRDYYLSVCRPLSPVQGCSGALGWYKIFDSLWFEQSWLVTQTLPPRCWPLCLSSTSFLGSGLGACFTETDSHGHVTGHSLGLVQSNPQAASDQGQGSAVTISYMGGDTCAADSTRRYSTRYVAVPPKRFVCSFRPRSAELQCRK